MRERDLLRTAESLADDLDAKLAAMPPREPTASDYWKGALDTVCFFVLSAVVVAFVMTFGSF